MKLLTQTVSFLFLLFSSTVSSTVILQYHHIDDETPKSTSTSPKLFKAHLDYLSENNFNVVSIETFLESIKKQKALPDKSVLITFDDGYQSILTNALPLLKEKNFPFVVFINTQPLKDKLSQFMDWNDLKTLIKNGGAIANHSVTHPHLIRRVAGESSTEWQQRIANEILQSQNEIEMNLGKTERAFAYPYGEYNFEVKKLLKKIGFYGFGQQSGAVSPEVDLQAIPRFPFGGVYGNLDDFKLKVNSLPLPVERVELFDSSGKAMVDHQLSPDNLRPQLKLTLKDKAINVNCYFGPQGQLEKVKQDDSLLFTTQENLTPGRNRFNCTAASGTKGRFYWFSQPWILPNPDGSWYRE